MNSKTKSILAALLAATMTLLVSGCATLLGTGVGLIVDHHNARPRHMTWAGTDSIAPGQQVTVTLRDSSMIFGTNQGTTSRPTFAYQPAYDSARSARHAELALPALGDTVSISNSRGNRVQWLFTGFGPEALALSDKHRDTTTAYLPLRDMTHWQDGHGAEIDLPRVQNLMQERALPLNRVLLVNSGPRTFNIPLESVSQVDCPGHNTHYWMLGAGIGLAVDVAITAAIVSAAMTDMDLGDWNMGGGSYKRP